MGLQGPKNAVFPDLNRFAWINLIINLAELEITKQNDSAEIGQMAELSTNATRQKSGFQTAEKREAYCQSSFSSVLSHVLLWNA